MKRIRTKIKEKTKAGERVKEIFRGELVLACLSPS